MASESEHSEQWEILSESSMDSFHITSPVKKIKIIENDIKSNNDDTDDNRDDDNDSVHSMESIPSIASVHSLQSQSSSSTTTSSSIEVIHASQQPSSLIPQIDENMQLNNNRNELIPSYVDIESELQSQRALINELKSQLNEVTQERDEAVVERDEFKSRIESNSREMARLRRVNLSIDRQNIALRNMQIKHRKRKIKKIESKSSVSLTNRKGHRPSIPAKLRFRRARTTHRSVYVQGRRW